MSQAPKELFLTFKEQWLWTGSETITTSIPLAFAHVYEPNKKGWDKKKKTQMTWAYGDYEEREDGVWLAKSRRWNSAKIEDVPATRVPEWLQPRVISNEPMQGFKISRSISRRSTSNKLWRIQDPRGFELEISTGNMEELLMNGTMSNGEFQGTMQWQTGKMLKFV